MMHGMVIDMNDEQLHTLAQLQAFLDGTIEVDFAAPADERYDFIARAVRRFGYGRLKRTDKAVLPRFPAPPQRRHSSGQRCLPTPSSAARIWRDRL